MSDLGGIVIAPGNVAPHSIRAEVDVDLVQRLSNTERFDVDGFLVIRRSTAFPIKLDTRSKLSVTSVTLVYEEGKKEVDLRVVKLDSKSYGSTVEVEVPANMPVTMYMLRVRGTFEDETPFEVEMKDNVVVLFNPWSKDDGVYLEDDAQRQEYVLNANGRLYIGDRYGTAWNLSLYKPNTLKAVLYILETLSKLSFEQKRDPVLVAREMSALVNVQDDNGVIVGRWDGEYSDGIDPSFWQASGQILEQFYQSGGEPVKYGQCWVFSAVLLTVLRVLGIPSRSVTNFSSAHDANRNRTVDEYYDEEGERLDYLSSGSDSIWNFHVWNETWMRRPDLPTGFDGWQAVDATPQEESPQGGGYKTGPSPLKAIKEGNSVQYDTNFVIAEVNADIKKYVVENGVPRLFQVDTRTVGQGISTKRVGSKRREDITDQYKYPEGSDWERRALYQGYKQLTEEVFDVNFFIPEAEYDFGQAVALKVQVTNKGRQHRVRGKIRCQAVTYTGRTLEDVKTFEVDIKVNKEKTVEVVRSVGNEIFSKFTGTKVFLKFTIGLAVAGTSQMFSQTVTLAPTPPKLTIEGPDKLSVGEGTKLLMTFKNPLPVEMTDVTLNIDVDDLTGEDAIQKIGTIGPNAVFKYVLEMTAVKLGVYTVVVGLTSDKVEHVTGEKEIVVVKSVPTTAPLPFDTLEIESVDLNTESNRKAHLTERYDYEGLVVRRGQSFTLNITTTKPFPKGAKVVTRAIFQLVSKSVFNRTAFEVKVVSSTRGDTVSLELKPPADVSVGEYDLLLTVDDAGLVSVLRQKIKLVILFNPWCIDDTCHYPNQSDLSEYVLNGSGRIWVGTSTSNYGRPWQFSQFSKDSLEVALWVLDQMKRDERSDPVKVVRKVSALTNIQDDNGILVGNWSGDYTGGTSPTDWTGSGPIMKEFNKTKEPVQYGQCWVFSGLQTTLFRCLGLPARSITNFNSAHDTDFNRAVDKFYDESGDPISADDSIWNFHVWNEAWMARPDLLGGFDGWQAVDATPQEESPQGGGFRLGPAPVRAVKLGQRMNFDVEFVISEVNADIRSYMVYKDGSQTLTRVNTTHVGQSMSTKAVGSQSRQDVTLDYKFKEGSTSERAALLAETESEKLIGVKLEVQGDILIGQDFVVSATVTNKASSVRTLKVRLYGRAMLYTNAPGQMVKEANVTENFKAGESKSYDMNVSDSDYLRILQGGNFIKFVCMALDEQNKKSVVTTEDFRLKTPDIAITFSGGGLKLYQPAEVTVSFTNPLNKTLTGGKFTLSGDGFVQDTTVDIPAVYPLNTAKAVLKTIPVKKGSFELVVRFSSLQLTDIMGDEDVEVS